MNEEKIDPIYKKRKELEDLKTDIICKVDEIVKLYEDEWHRLICLEINQIGTSLAVDYALMQYKKIRKDRNRMVRNLVKNCEAINFG